MCDNFDETKSGIVIKFFFNEVSIRISNRLKLKRYLADLFFNEGIPLNKLVYVFCTDKYLLEINKKFLNHDTFTDIITFTLSDIGEPIIGEVYISVERVQDNARVLNIPLNTELHRVIFHGALHLCGYKDKFPVNKIKMTAAEDMYLGQYFI